MQQQVPAASWPYKMCLGVIAANESMEGCNLGACCVLLSGGPDGVKSVATKLIEQHQLDDTFYIVDLANVVRLFKV